MSEHGKEWLRERSELNEEEFLHLMDHGGRKRIYSKFNPSLSPIELEKIVEATGLSFSELRVSGAVQLVESFRHYLVWSIPDQKLLTAVVAMPGSTIVTVLIALDFTSHDWSDRLTETVVSEANVRAIGLTSPKSSWRYLGVHEAILFWLDCNGHPK